MAPAMGAATPPPEPSPSVQKPMTTTPQLCWNVTRTSVRDIPNAVLRRSSQKTASALFQTCKSMTTPRVKDRLSAVLGKGRGNVAIEKLKENKLFEKKLQEIRGFSREMFFTKSGELYCSKIWAWNSLAPACYECLNLVHLSFFQTNI